jgi:hypothetical protein
VQICSLFGWLVLVCSERRVLLAGCWFVVGEKYCWLVADKPANRALARNTVHELKFHILLFLINSTMARHLECPNLMN